MLYYNIANPESWIVVSVGITGVVTVILFIVGIIISKNKKQKDDAV